MVKEDTRVGNVDDVVAGQDDFVFDVRGSDGHTIAHSDFSDDFLAQEVSDYHIKNDQRSFFLPNLFYWGRQKSTFVTPLIMFRIPLAMVRRQAACLRPACHKSTLIFVALIRSSCRSMCLNSLVSVPRGPFTVTLRAFASTVTTTTQKSQLFSAY